MQAGTYGETLRRAADQLSAEFADPTVAELSGIRPSLGGRESMNGRLDAEDEALVARLREVFAGIASTLSARATDPPVRVIETALDGAEFVIRSEIVRGDADRLLELIPSILFLLAVSATDRDRALEISRRATEIIEKIG